MTTDSEQLTATDKLPRIEKTAHALRPKQPVPALSTGYSSSILQATLKPPQEQQEAMAPNSTSHSGTFTFPSAQTAESMVADEAAREQTPKKKRWLGLTLRLAVTLALFVFLFKSVSWPQIWSTLLHLDPSIALVGLVIGLYTLIVSAYQWQCLLRGQRIQIDLTRLVNLYMVGIAFNHFLPTSMGGDVVKVYYVAREGKNMSGSASAAIMARITGFFGMLLVAFPALLIWKASFSPQVTTLLLLLSGLVLLMVSATFCLALLFTRLAQSHWLLRLLNSVLPSFLYQKPFYRKFLSKGIDIGNTLIASTKQPSPMIGSILFGMLFHIVACLNYFCFGMALHMSVPLSFYLMAIPLTALIAFLPISINGFGLREGTIVLVFTTAHVPAATALLLAFAMDVQMLLFGLIGICIYILMEVNSSIGKTIRREEIV